MIIREKVKKLENDRLIMKIFLPLQKKKKIEHLKWMFKEKGSLHFYIVFGQSNYPFLKL